jgi:hypothetical protein
MKSASPDITILFGQGSPMTDITELVLSEVPIADAGLTEDVTPYRATAVVNQFLGISNPPDLSLDMLFDDADNGTMDLFATKSGPNTPDYTLQVNWTPGSPMSYSTWLCGIKESAIVGKVKGATRMRVVLTSRGPVTHVRNGA